ncbi:MAG: hypothetical protein JSS53_08145 [Proteobacteria bacterium]|nr:hypothetical protein [Pseudomonadota bacterium]
MPKKNNNARSSNMRTNSAPIISEEYDAGDERSIGDGVVPVFSNSDLCSSTPLFFNNDKLSIPHHELALKILANTFNPNAIMAFFEMNLLKEDRIFLWIFLATHVHKLPDLHETIKTKLNSLANRKALESADKLTKKNVALYFNNLFAKEIKDPLFSSEEINIFRNEYFIQALFLDKELFKFLFSNNSALLLLEETEVPKNISINTIERPIASSSSGSDDMPRQAVIKILQWHWTQTDIEKFKIKFLETDADGKKFGIGILRKMSENAESIGLTLLGHVRWLVQLSDEMPIKKKKLFEALVDADSLEIHCCLVSNPIWKNYIQSNLPPEKYEVVKESLKDGFSFESFNKEDTFHRALGAYEELEEQQKNMILKFPLFATDDKRTLYLKAMKGELRATHAKECVKILKLMIGIMRFAFFTSLDDYIGSYVDVRAQFKKVFELAFQLDDGCNPNNYLLAQFPRIIRDSMTPEQKKDYENLRQQMQKPYEAWSELKTPRETEDYVNFKTTLLDSYRKDASLELTCDCEAFYQWLNEAIATPTVLSSQRAKQTFFKPDTPVWVRKDMMTGLMQVLQPYTSCTSKKLTIKLNGDAKQALNAWFSRVSENSVALSPTLPRFSSSVSAASSA